MRYFNFHTHTKYCDGSSNPEEYVIEAIRLGFESLGFSGHAPVSFENGYAIKEEDLQQYCTSILELKNRYKEINIYLALEADYIRNLTKSFNAFKRECGLDYIIGSVHLVSNPNVKGLWFIDGSNIDTFDNGLRYVFNEDIRKAVGAFYHQTNEMITNQHPDIIGHFDKVKMNNKGRYFSVEEKWYNDLVNESLDVIKESGCIMEVNTRGLYKKRSDELFPSATILKRIHKMNIPITLSSDAHKPTELALCFDDTLELLQEIGFKTLMVFDKASTSFVPKSIH
ncbi:MAG: histidinol-phosphatase [Bacteroidota bacterium]